MKQKEKKTMKDDLIFSEEIEIAAKDIKISRQKDTPNGKWYGIMICGQDDVIADNEEWILNELYPRLKDKDYYGLNKDGFDKETCKNMKRLIKTAIKLGWFDDINPEPKE